MSLRWLLIWSTVWATAFGFIEGAVAVYLRQIIYPDGFRLPWRAIDSHLLWIELVREAATIVVLLGFAKVAARGLRSFAVFIFCFGVWDLVYYIVLKAFLDWPASLMDWDLLFLIPLPWSSPVLAPVLVSLTLIGAAVVILVAPEDRGFSFGRPTDWVIETIAGLVIVGSFLWNVPTYYPWWMFLLGWLGGLGWFVWCWLGRSSSQPAREG
jgi:hypothetical protein